MKKPVPVYHPKAVAGFFSGPSDKMAPKAETRIRKPRKTSRFRVPVAFGWLDLPTSSYVPYTILRKLKQLIEGNGSDVRRVLSSGVICIMKNLKPSPGKNPTPSQSPRHPSVIINSIKDLRFPKRSSAQRKEKETSTKVEQESFRKTSKNYILPARLIDVVDKFTNQANGE